MNKKDLYKLLTGTVRPTIFQNWQQQEADIRRKKGKAVAGATVKDLKVEGTVLVCKLDGGNATQMIGSWL